MMSSSKVRSPPEVANFGQDYLENIKTLGAQLFFPAEFIILCSSRISAGLVPLITTDPNKIIGKRTSKMDQKYVNDPLNLKVFPEFHPNNIYEIKVLPADERSIHKYNGATFNKVDLDHNSNSM